MFRQTESTVRPTDIDTTSSSGHVYIRKNQKKITRYDGTEIWVYDEACITSEEYKRTVQFFGMPEYEELKNKVADQQIMLAEVAVNTEYFVCLQEL